jgi:subtilisin family serine protease
MTLKPRFLFTALLTTSLVAGFGLEARTVVRLSPGAVSNSGSSGFLTTQSGDSSSGSSNSVPPGWKYLRSVDMYVVDQKGNELLNTLKKEGSVEAAESADADNDVHLEAVPNDPMASTQGWVEGAGEIHAFDISTSGAWDLVNDSSDVVVAIIDTGIDLNHEDLRDNLWTNQEEIPGNGIDDDHNGYVDDQYGYNFSAGNANVSDDNNHGSHLAGIIGAVGNNGVGIAGVNWHVKLMALKFADAHGVGSSIGAIEAINYAIENGANVINASWTLKLDGKTQGDSLLKQAIEKAGEAGIVFVAAAGNQFQTGEGLNIDETPVYPASFSLKNLIAVAALGYEDELASYSNYGPESVDIAAPGSSILSTLANGKYGYMSGTSMATAFVSGAAALAFSIRPDMAPSEIKTILKNESDKVESLSGFVSSGKLNLTRSVTAVSSSVSSSSSTSEPHPTGEGAPAGGCSLIPE